MEFLQLVKGSRSKIDKARGCLSYFTFVATILYTLFLCSFSLLSYLQKHGHFDIFDGGFGQYLWNQRMNFHGANFFGYCELFLYVSFFLSKFDNKYIKYFVFSMLIFLLFFSGKLLINLEIW